MGRLAGVMEGRYVSAVVLCPGSVVVGEHGWVEQSGQVDLEQGTERMDRQIDQGRQIIGLEVSDVHVSGLLSVRNG